MLRAMYRKKDLCPPDGCCECSHEDECAQTKQQLDAEEGELQEEQVSDHTLTCQNCEEELTVKAIDGFSAIDEASWIRIGVPQFQGCSEEWVSAHFLDFCSKKCLENAAKQFELSAEWLRAAAAGKSHYCEIGTAVSHCGFSRTPLASRMGQVIRLESS